MAASFAGELVALWYGPGISKTHRHRSRFFTIDPYRLARCVRFLEVAGTQRNVLVTFHFRQGMPFEADMRVLVLGGTGSIGAPIVREFVRGGHQVTALVRSDASARKVASFGAQPLYGSILTPTSWVASISRFDGLVHAAATFGDDEESIQQQLLDVLLPFLATLPETMRFLYTGGCWLYGTYKGQVTTEDSPFDPLPAFAWGVPHIQRVLASPGIFPIVIHPAMVYEEAGGVFERFHRDAVTRRAVRVVASESTRWPLVHGDDLAILYRLAFEKSAPGESYIGAAIDGMPVGQIARAFAQRFRTPSEMPETISEDDVASELGNWARGFALDQVQSGEKAMTKLGWKPGHLDPEAEIAAIC